MDGVGAGRRKLSPFALLVLLWVVPVTVCAIGIFGSRWASQQITSAETIETVLLGSRMLDAKQGAVVVATLGEAQPVRVNASGIVTGLSIGEGSVVSLGEEIIEIDGSPRFAYSGDTPFFRDLFPGQTGGDVSTLAAFLGTAGYLSEVEPTVSFSWEISQALMAFQHDAGLHADGVLRREDFVFVPKGFDTVREVHIALGASVSQDGVIAKGSEEVDELRVLASGTEMKLQGYGERDKLILGSDDQKVTISNTVLTGDEASSLVASLDNWAMKGLIERDIDQMTLRYSGLFASLAEPLEVASAPNTAVFSDRNGLSCVIQLSAEGTRQSRVINIRSIPGELGTVGIDADLIGTEVLRSTIGVSDSLTCP